MWNIWSDYRWWLLHFPKPHKINWIDFSITLNNFVALSFSWLYFKMLWRSNRKKFEFRYAYAHVAIKYQTDRSVSRFLVNCFTFVVVVDDNVAFCFTFIFYFSSADQKRICSFVFWVCSSANLQIHFESKYNLIVVPTCLMRISCRFRVHNTKTHETEILSLDKIKLQFRSTLFSALTLNLN